MSKIEALDKYQQKLVLSALDVVKWIIYKEILFSKNITGLEFDDLFQEGCIALCKAASTYDGSTQFATYAKAVVRKALISYCRKISRRRKKVSFVSLSAAVPDEDGNTLTLLDKFTLPIEHQNDEFTIGLLETIKQQYSGVARLGIEALELKIMGYTGAEIAEMHGVKPNHVGAWISRASQKLRQNNLFIEALKDKPA